VELKSANFITSAPNYLSGPRDNKPEYAFIGRSNVGKSTLINFLTRRKNLAKTSAKPGKTKLINYFEINNSWYLVDLPGYGYAKTSKKERKTLVKIVEDYIVNREPLICLFVLIDARHEPMKIDIDVINWLGFNKIPFVLVFTKTDKLTGPQLEKNIGVYKKELHNYWAELPKMFYTSALKKTGKEEILEYIEEVNNRLSMDN
jgi:GTP-binding protein